MASNSASNQRQKQQEGNDEFDVITAISSIDFCNEPRNDEVHSNLSPVDFELRGTSEMARDVVLNSLDRMMAGNFEFLLISGPSGCGKTTLVEQTLREKVSLQHGGFFTSGLFDKVQNQPYSAVVSCFTDIIDLIIQSEESEFYARRLKSATTSNEGTIIRNLLSNLSYILPEDQSPCTPDPQSFSRFKSACGKFLKAVSSKQHPLVLFFDSMHCSDLASLELIQALLLEKLDHVLFVGCFDSHEMDAESLIGLSTRSLKANITELKLANLTMADLNELYTSILKHEDPIELTKLAMSRTAGNLRQSIEFLKFLETELLINYENYVWKWDVDSIAEATTLSESVLFAVTLRIKRLEKAVLQVLQLAACMGFQFNPADLMDVSLSILDQNGNMFVSQNDIFPHALSVVISEQMIEKVSADPQVYRFAHFDLFETVYNMIPDDNKPNIHYQIGRHLRQKLHTESTCEALLLSVDQLNRGLSAMSAHEELKELVELNVTAGKLVAAKSAFVMASDYLEKACALNRQLFENPWKTDYTLMLDAMTNLCEMYISAGILDRGECVAHEIIKDSESLDDKLSAYSCLVQSLLMQSKTGLAMSMACAVLNKLNYSMPKKAHLGHAVFHILKAKLAVMSLCHERLMASPVSEDKQYLTLMKMLAVVAQCSFLLQESEFIVVSLESLMRLTVRKGLTPYAPLAYAGYAMISTLLGNPTEGYQYGSWAIDMVNKLSDRVGALTLTTASQFSLHYCQSIQEQVEVNLKSYQMGIQSGDVGSAFLAAQTAVYCGFFASEPLATCEERAALFCHQMKEYSQQTWHSMTVPYWQMFLNLMKDVEDPLVLTGDAMVEEELAVAAEREKNELILRTLALAKLELALFFGLWGPGAELARFLMKGSEQATAHINYYIFQFCAAMVFMNAANDAACTMTREYRRKARKAIGEVRKGLKKGFVNNAPLLKILEAEEMKCSPNTKTDEVISAYTEAFSVCQNSGYSHYLGLLHENLAIYLAEIKETNLSNNHFGDAVEMFREWGALGKMNDTLDKQRLLETQHNPNENIGTVPSLLEVQGSTE